ncbi:Dynein axonemal assembly factor 10 [Trebouxia sp. C0010 RCD-2024]
MVAVQNAQSKPRILELLQTSLTVTIHDTKWIPGTAKFVALGEYARNTGCLQVFELQDNTLQKAQEIEKPARFKCGTFGASSMSERQLATGSFQGQLQMWDLEHTKEPVYTATAHASIINQIDGSGGQSNGFGPPEMVSCGSDGCVRVWDVRQDDQPVSSFEPLKGSQARDCWCVAFGNSYNDEERCVLAGYDNGDVKMFDLRTNKLRWEGNVRNGVCGVQFDRRDINMNKFVVTCLESQFHVYEARTQHPHEGFASLTETTAKGASLWKPAHLPQNRDVFMVTAGDGTAHLYKYKYPDQRRVKDANGKAMGVIGSLELLAEQSLSSQPVTSFDWSADKEGLFCCGALDQTVRVGIAIKLNTV